CPYDAELFGHWWFEGPWWLEAVLRRLATTPELRAATPGDDLARHPTLQRATPAASTWGWKGYNEVWLAGENDWLYRHLHAAADRLHALCRSYPSADERTRLVALVLLPLALVLVAGLVALLARPLAAPALAALERARFQRRLAHTARGDAHLQERQIEAALREFEAAFCLLIVRVDGRLAE